MKLLCYTERSLGQKGNSGTYLLIEELSKLFSVLSISNPPDQNTVLDSVGFETAFLHPKSSDPLAVVEGKVRDFAPDAIYMFNHDGWWTTAARFRAIAPGAKIYYDVQTPLLQKDQERDRIQREGTRFQCLIDHVFSLSNASTLSWIPDCHISSSEYPLGIDYDKISALSNTYGGAVSRTKADEPLRLVYIGALASVRKMETLVEGVLDYADVTGGKVLFDIYGSGETEQLRELVRQRDNYNVVSLKGLVGVDTLFSLLGSYDVGLAWVPKELFSESPSLKLLEYAAAKLRILATDTVAHLRVLDEGYKFGAHGDTKEDVLNALMSRRYLETDVDVNVDKVKKKSYKNIVRENIAPTIFEANKVPKRIGFIVVPSLAQGKGGAENVALQLCSELVKRGFTIFVAYQVNKDFLSPAYEIPENVVPVPYQDIGDFSTYLRSFSPDFAFCFVFNRDVVKYSKVIIQEGIPFGFQECTNPDRLVSVTWRFPSGENNKKLATWERQVVASQACRVRLVMPGYESSYPEIFKNQVRAFSNSCPDVQLEQFEKTNEKKYIISVNGLKENKNFETLIHAFSRISRQFPDWTIVDVGKPLDRSKAYHQKVSRLISGYGLDSQVEFYGLTDNIYELFENSQFHVISSLSEGCPTVVLEAMACGVASLGFEDCMGTNRLIRNGVDGILVGSEDRIASLSDGLKVLMADEQLRQSLGKAAAQASSDYSSQTVYDEWERLFLDMCEYKKDRERLFSEQMAIDRETAMHFRRVFSDLDG